MRKTVLVLLLILLLLDSGCWSRREVEKLAIIGAVGFDKVTLEDGSDTYRVTVVVYQPGKMVGGSEGGGGKPLAPYWVVTALGDTLLDAGRNLSRRSSRYMFLAHSQVVVIGERLAREDGMDGVLDLILRHKDIRLRNWIFVSEGDAMDALSAQPELEPTLPQEVAAIKEQTQPVVSKSYVNDAKVFIQQLLSPGRSAVAGKLKVYKVPENLPPPTKEEQPRQSIRLDGIAVFHGSKLAGWMGNEESRGLLFVLNEAMIGIIPLKLPGSQEKEFSFQMTKARTKILPAIRDGEFSFTLEVKAEGNIGDLEDGVPAATTEEINKLDKIVAAEIKRLIEKTVRKSQDMQADIFGFGEIIHRKYPREWDEVKQDWNDIYSYLPVEVKVEVKIRGTGMMFNPISVRRQ